MKTIHVSAAIIFDLKSDVKKVFATQRGYGSMKGGWEFPGGKLEEGESGEECIKREILEELETEISVESKLGTVEYDYPDFHLVMDCFVCSVVTGELKLLEHEDAKWLDSDSLMSVNWLPADVLILDKVKEILKIS